MPRLGKRLLKIAEFIPAGSRVADIGTDHAVLPIHLIRSGLASLAIATDINKKPLGKAAENIDAAALSDYITLRLGDGLSCIEPNEVDTIIIAGMSVAIFGSIINMYTGFSQVEEEKIKLIVPTIDTELIILAENKELIEEKTEPSTELPRL